MTRILEFSPSQEEAVVARILVLVHQAVDTHFPSAEQANRQFTKTVFSGEGERTAGLKAAPDDEKGSAFATDERTLPGGPGTPEGDKSPFIPPPPGRPAGAFAQGLAKTDPPGTAPGQSGFGSNVNPLNIGQSGLSRSTRLDSTMEQMKQDVGLDWIMRFTLAALVAGLILLAYFIWKFINLA